MAVVAASKYAAVCLSVDKEQGDKERNEQHRADDEFCEERLAGAGCFGSSCSGRGHASEVTLEGLGSPDMLLWCSWSLDCSYTCCVVLREDAAEVERWCGFDIRRDAVFVRPTKPHTTNI